MSEKPNDTTSSALSILVVDDDELNPPEDELDHNDGPIIDLPSSESPPASSGPS